MVLGSCLTWGDGFGVCVDRFTNRPPVLPSELWGKESPSNDYLFIFRLILLICLSAFCCICCQIVDYRPEGFYCAGVKLFVPLIVGICIWFTDMYNNKHFCRFRADHTLVVLSQGPRCITVFPVCWRKGCKTSSFCCPWSHTRKLISLSSYWYYRKILMNPKGLLYF